ncbi:MAG: PASTA domain-containing protein [Bacteroidota bacterium]
MDVKAILEKIKQKVAAFVGEQTRISLWGNSWIALLLNLGVMALIFGIVVFIFFYVHLPATTNHGERHYVPDLVGMDLEEARDYLEERSFRHQIADTSYNPNFKPREVIRQNPLPEAAVKVNRRIYLTINAESAPLTKVPYFIGYSSKTAQNELQTAKLRVGKITMIPHEAKNAVQEVWYKGRRISEESLERGFEVPEGSSIDLKVGSGQGDNKGFGVPPLVGKNWEEAEFTALGNGLNLGIVHFVYDPEQPLHKVIKQSPASGDIKVGETVDIWVISHTKEDE